MRPSDLQCSLVIYRQLRLFFYELVASDLRTIESNTEHILI